MLARRDVRLLLGGALIALFWLAAREFAGHESGLLYLLPALAVMTPLFLQRYPGEQRILALAAKLRRSRPRASRRPAATRPARRLILAGTGDVLAFEHAGRAPPPLR